ASEFDKSLESWAALASDPKNKKPPEPVPSGLRSLAQIARLQAGATGTALDRARKELFAAAANPNCTSTLMTVAFCQASVEMGRRWMGWMALQRDDLVEAERDFAAAVGTGWREWVAGRKAFSYGRYAEAA